jgi:hypothetical protein
MILDITESELAAIYVAAISPVQHRMLKDIFEFYCKQKKTWKPVDRVYSEAIIKKLL